VLATDMIQNHVAQFVHSSMHDTVQTDLTVAAYVDGLSAVVALTIMGRHGSKEDVIEGTNREAAREHRTRPKAPHSQMTLAHYHSTTALTPAPSYPVRTRSKACRRSSIMRVAFRSQR